MTRSGSPAEAYDTAPVIHLMKTAYSYGDKASYQDFQDRYREMAISLGFQGHIVWAEAIS